MNSLGALVAAIFDRRSYLAYLYVLMRFPLAIVYLAIASGFLGSGLGLLFLGVGALLLAIFLLIVRITAEFERGLGAWWFDFQLAPMGPLVPAAPSAWRRFVAFFLNPVTWKSLAFYFIQVIAGLTVPVVFLAGLAVAVALLFGPIVIALDAASFHAGDPQNAPTLAVAVQALGLDVASVTLYLVGSLVGLVMLIVFLNLARLAVAGQAWLVATLLRASDAQLAVASARAEAATQHARAERSEQSRRELVVNASHELRTPIASVRAHVDALLDPERPPSAADRERYLAVIQREAERLSSLADDLVAVARADSGELRLDVRPTDVRAVAEQVAGALAPIADRDRHVKLVSRFPESPVSALADPDRLSQVLMNLVRNAITYTPEGGLVAIEIADGGPLSVVIAVEDTGAGIPTEELDRIFDRFYRTDSSRARATGGFGLGLAISRDLVEAMGGRLEVSSTPDVGSRFEVRLQRAA